MSNKLQIFQRTLKRLRDDILIENEISWISLKWDDQDFTSIIKIADGYLIIEHVDPEGQVTHDPIEQYMTIEGLQSIADHLSSVDLHYMKEKCDIAVQMVRPSAIQSSNI